MKNSRLLSFWLFAISILILNTAGWWWSKSSGSDASQEEDATPSTVIPAPPLPQPAAPTNRPSRSQPFYVTGITAKAASFGDPEITVTFSEQPDMKDIQLLVRATPAIELTIMPLEWRWESGFRIKGPFRPGNLYTFTFSPGIKTSKGVSLDKEIQRSVLVPHRAPAIAFDAPGRYLAPHGKLTVPVKSVNCTSLVTTVSRVLPQNLVYFAKNDLRTYNEDAENVEDLTQGGATQALRLPQLQDKEQRSFLHLASLIPQAQRGVFLVEIKSEHGAGESRLVAVTDIGISAREEPGAYTVWATSLATGSAAPDHTVKLYGRNNALLGQATTDAQGVARLPFNEKQGDPFLLVIESPAQADSTFLALYEKNQVEQLTQTSERFLKPNAAEAFVFTDREIYRHGETVFAQALLRKQDNTPPAPFPVLLRVLKPNAQLFKSIPLMADALGCVTAEFTMPDYLPSGTYRGQFVLPGEDGTLLGDCRFSLESFVPPQIRVKHRNLPAAVMPGDKLVVSVEAEHLFGKAAGGLNVESMILFKPVRFAPADWQEYLFGDNEKSFTVQRSATQEATLDAEGRAALTNEIPKNMFPPAALEAIVQSSVLEPGGRSVTARSAVPTHPYPFYIGIRKPAKNIVRAGTEQTLAVAAVFPDGKRKTDPVTLAVKLENISWICNLRKDSRGYYAWESERIKSLIFTNSFVCSGQDTAYPFMAPADTGDYLLTLTDPLSQTSTSWAFTSSDSDKTAAAWDRSAPDRVKLVFDKESYLPGETVRLQIRSPFPGLAWVTLQQQHILENRLITMTNNTADITWTAHASWSPNLEVAVSVIRPAVAESVWSAHRASGIAPLRVTPASHKLAVSIQKLAPVAAPKTTLPVTVNVTAASGQPAREAAVTLLAVDEGICMLTGMETPAPYDFFKRIRTAGHAFFDIFEQLMPITDENALNSASHVGGDGEEDFAIKRLNPVASRRFKPVALWKGNVALDANGSATIPLELPEFTGELRLMAIAWDKQGTGSSDTSIKVKRNMVVQPDMPRFLAPKDQALFPVTLHNEGGKPLSVQITASADALLSIAATNQTLQLNTGESRTVLLSARAEENVGLAHVSLAVQGGDERYEETFELAVRPALAWDETAEHRILKAGETAELAMPSTVLAATFSQTVHASTRPFVNLIGALEFVITYPYGCLEQTTSSAFPLIPLKELSRQIAFKNTSLGEEAPDIIQAAISRILSMQRYDGFAMWPGGYETARYPSVYAAHFLVEASTSGYNVPADTLAFCTQFLETEISRDHAEVTPYACHVLALAKRPAHNTMLRLFEETNALSVEDRFHLARALLRSGDIPKARGVLETVRSVTGLREAAFGILAWCDLDPAAPMVVTCAQEIEKKRTRYGHWGTTQENALALLALGRLAQHMDLSKKTEALPVTWNGTAFTLPSTNTLHWTTQKSATLQNGGDDLIYVTRTIRAVPQQDLRAGTEEGLSVRRRFLHDDDTEVDLNNVARGDIVWIEISIDPHSNPVSDVVIEDLLPAGLEVEMGSDRRAALPSDSWIAHREVRDDRVLLFAKPLKNRETYRYAARAVTSGTFIVPAISATAMYDLTLYSRQKPSRIVIN